MSRPIDADALIEKYGDWYTEEGSEEGYIGTIKGMVDSMPTIEPEPKTGEWNFDGNQMFECTNCGVAYTEYQFERMRVRCDDPKLPKFCPNCGSYNGGDSDDQT